MLEDALTSTRNSYRLVLLISIISIVFSQSLNKPKEAIEKNEILERAIELDLSAYDSFAAKKLRDINFEDDFQMFSEQINSYNFQIFGVDKILSAIQELKYAGKINIKNTIFNDLANCKINSLNSINELEIKNDIIIFQPELNSLSSKIIEYLSSFQQQGLSINNVSINGLITESDPSTFYALKNPSVSIYFEITSPTSTGSIPVFNAEVHGKTIKLPNTSFLHWVEQNSIDGRILKIVDNKILWFSESNLFKELEKVNTIGELLKNNEDKLEAFAPENQVVNVVGISIPGIFFFVAAPFLIIAMLYSLLTDLNHLLKIFEINIDQFKLFSWSAISPNRYAYIEALVILIILPSISNILLLYQIIQFPKSNVVLLIFILLTLIINIFLSIPSMRKITNIRRNMMPKE